MEADDPERWVNELLDKQAREFEQLSDEELMDHPASSLVVSYLAGSYVGSDHWPFAHPDDPEMRQHLIEVDGCPENSRRRCLRRCGRSGVRAD